MILCSNGCTSLLQAGLGSTGIKTLKCMLVHLLSEGKMHQHPGILPRISLLWQGPAVEDGPAVATRLADKHGDVLTGLQL